MTLEVKLDSTAISTHPFNLKVTFDIKDMPMMVRKRIADEIYDLMTSEVKDLEDFHNGLIKWIEQGDK